MADLEYPDIQTLLSRPATAAAGDVTRRRFLAGALATGGAVGLLPSRFDALAGAATPVAPDEGILVVIQMGGGNDGLNTVVPRVDGRYRDLRGALAITDPLPISPSTGLHPALAQLKARYDSGRVAIVHGVGQTGPDLSHFSSTATWMAGTGGTERSSGWLGRWLDGVPEASSGLRAVSFGPSVPLHLQGRQAVVTALDTGGDLFGADRSDPALAALHDLMGDLAASSTGKGVWADRLAASSALAVDLAGDLDPLFTPALPDDSLVSQLTLAARLVNADLGIRVLGATFGSFDTHNAQATAHQQLLAELDAGIAAFYGALQPSRSRQVVLLTFSEFGRRPQANASGGTDHGTAAPMLLIGDNVRGGHHGVVPRLDDLDDRGNLRVHVDFRSVYASVLGGWLGADSGAVMGGTFEEMRLFQGAPGAVVTPPVTSGPWIPFATATALVQQQYRDFLGREGDTAGVAFWAGRLTGGTSTVPKVVRGFMDSPEFGVAMAPAARMALATLAEPPAYADLTTWTGLVRTGGALGEVAALVAAHPTFAARYGGLATAAAVTAVHQDLMGTAPTASVLARWRTAIDDEDATLADLLAELTPTATCAARWRRQVEVLMAYAGLLRRRPDDAGWDYWVAQAAAGITIERLVALFFASAEYRNRFS